MRILMLVHLSLIGLGMAIFSVNTWQQSLSFGLGGLIMFANVALLAFVWDRILRKKFVALGILTIVTKYAFLGLVLYKALELPWVDGLYLSFGVGSFVIAASIYGLIGPRDFVEAQGNT